MQSFKRASQPITVALAGIVFFTITMLFSVEPVSAQGAVVGPPTREQAEAANGDSVLSNEVKTGLQGLNKLKTTSPQKLVGRIIKIAMGVVGSVALLMFVGGGIMYMTARGNSERTVMATKTLVWSSLGVAMILASYVLVNFIFTAIG